jgi:hypothetical protein
VSAWRHPERRNGRRFTVAEGHCAVRGRPGQVLQGGLVDLSLSGLRFEAAHGLHTGDPLDLELIPASGRNIVASVRICRVAPAGYTATYGAEFADLAPQERRALNAYLLRLRRLTWDDQPVDERPRLPERLIWVHATSRHY